MKTLNICIAAVILLIVVDLVLDGPASPVGAGPRHQTAASLSVVRLERTFIASSENSACRVRGFSLGTAVGPNIIVTHNHFAPALGTVANEVMRFTDASGKTTEVPVTRLVIFPIDPGTLLIYLPADVSMNSVPASVAAPSQLANGDWLDANYWDDTAGGFAQQRFQITRIENGVAVLADPQRLVNPGDSGGGVYVDGQLIGNLWSMNLRNNRSAGTFNVALLSDLAVNLFQPAAARSTDTWPEIIAVEAGVAR